MSNSYTPPDRCKYFSLNYYYLLLKLYKNLIFSLNLATYDPGWNDPPPNTTTTANSVSSSGKTRLNLNKRVAFPLQSSGASSNTSNVKTTAEGLPLPFSTAKYQPPPTADVLPPNPQQNVLAPPPISSLPPTSGNITATKLVTSTAPQDDSVDLTAAREFCFALFIRLLDSMKIDAVKLSEIRKRLDTLNEMWIDNKFNENVQKDIFKLAKGKTFNYSGRQLSRN